jgi:hypothetical protein
MTLFVLVACFGFAANSPCTTFEDPPTYYRSEAECQSDADWLTKQPYQGPQDHVQCVRDRGREVYTYLEVVKN